MALTFSPGQFSKRAEFYFQLSQLLAAGVTLTAALGQLERRPPARSYREPIRRALEDIQEGFTFSEALERQGKWLPEFDLALLRAGEQSGRLDACFRLLSDFYAERALTLRQMLSDLIYPLALFHFAVFLLPFPSFFLTGNLMAYGLQTLGVLLPCYAVVALVVYACQSSHGETWRAKLEWLLHPVPVLGGARRSLALSRLAAALEGLLSAGVTIVEAWELAAAASGSPALRRIVLGWRPLLDAGRTPSEVMAESNRFPDLFANQYASAELSGTLEDTLRRMHRYYADEGLRKIRALATWAPRLFYFAVVLMIAYRVVSFYSNYFRQIRDAGGF